MSKKDTKALEVAYDRGFADGQRAWQPIETAPKDGSMIMVYGRMIEGETQYGPAPHTAMWFMQRWGHREVFIDATHWMPLPPPPEVGP